MEAATLNATTQIVAAYVSHNPIRISDIHDLIKAVDGALTALANGTAKDATLNVPAVSIKKSITPDFLVCLEDGRRLKMLKRYLHSNYEMTPEQYRTKWGLAHNYPMVAPNYSAQRRELAKKIGLGKMTKTQRGGRRK